MLLKGKNNFTSYLYLSLLRPSLSLSLAQDIQVLNARVDAMQERLLSTIQKAKMVLIYLFVFM